MSSISLLNKNEKKVLGFVIKTEVLLNLKIAHKYMFLKKRHSLQNKSLLLFCFRFNPKTKGKRQENMFTPHMYILPQ